MSIFNYVEKFLPSRKMRRKILPYTLNLLPDDLQTQLMCYLKLGRFAELKSPKRFTDKIFYYRKHYNNPLLSELQDKLKVRKYIESKGFASYLTKLYCSADSVESIEFDNLPNAFVVKDTLGDFAKEVLVVRDKNIFGGGQIKKVVQSWNKKKESKIIVEELLPKNKEGKFYDYKFFCFSGKVQCLYVVDNSENEHRLSFYDRGFNCLNVSRKDYFPPITDKLTKPQNYDEMIVLAEKLSQGFPHVRVDLYNIGGKIYFGELTFFTAGGFCVFEPDSFDFELGKYFDIEKI